MAKTVKKSRPPRFTGAVPDGFASPGVMVSAPAPVTDRETWEAAGRPCWLVRVSVRSGERVVPTLASTNVPLCVPLCVPLVLPDGAVRVEVGHPDLPGGEWVDALCVPVADPYASAEHRVRTYGSGQRRAVFHGSASVVDVTEFSPSGTDPDGFTPVRSI